MKSLKLIAIGLMSALLVSSCATKKEETDESTTKEQERVDRFDETIDIHDEVMPLLDSIFNSKSLIMEELQRATDGVKELNEERKKALREIAEELENADEAMFEWMRNHGAMPADTLPHEVIMERLDESLMKIKEVRSIMLESLEEARQVITEDSESNQ